MSYNEEKARAATTAEVSCLGKVPFSSFTLANAVTTRQHNKHRDGRSAYHCTHCHQWHIGTNSGQRAKDRHDHNQAKAR